MWNGSPELQGVVFAAGAHVVDEEVVLSDLVPLLGVVPEPTGIGDQEPVSVHEGVVDRDDPVIAVTGRGVLLEFVQASPVEVLDVPVGGGEEAVEARLIGGPGEFAVDTQNGLALGADPKSALSPPVA